ncbi:hypothetical protein CYMTET_32424, partial [Cymbomonas tetramitiformis]
GERDLWMARAKEAEATLEAKREALADRMKAESDSVKAAREAAAARVQREAAGSRAVRMEMETEVNNAKVEASNARRELQKFQREAADAHHRLEPLTKQLDEARLEIETKTSALWAAEHALEVSAAEKLKLREENDQMKIETTRALAQSQGLKNSLLEELSANSHSKETMLRHEEEKDLLKADVRKAYEQVEDQILEANKARNAALHAQELMEKKQIHVR